MKHTAPAGRPNRRIPERRSRCSAVNPLTRSIPILARSSGLCPKGRSHHIPACSITPLLLLRAELVNRSPDVSSSAASHHRPAGRTGDAVTGHAPSMGHRLSAVGTDAVATQSQTRTAHSAAAAALTGATLTGAGAAPSQSSSGSRTFSFRARSVTSWHRLHLPNHDNSEWPFAGYPRPAGHSAGANPADLRAP